MSDEELDKNNTHTSEFDNIIFPMVKRVFAKTMADNLFFASDEEINAVKNKIKIENRENKISSILEDKKYVEKKLEDDPEYQKLKKKGSSTIKCPIRNTFLYR